jgi:hypothetical protein
MNSHCLALLDKLGYLPVPSQADHIVSESIKKSLESLFGQVATRVILNYLASFYGLSEKELTSNYDIFEKSLFKISSYGAKKILKDIRKQMLIETIKASLGSEITEQDILNPDIGIGDIIKKISYHEVTKFVHEIPSGEHINLIYENEDTKDKVLSAFLGEYHQDDTAKSQIISRRALISNRQTKFNYVNSILHYENLPLDTEKSELVSKIWQWMNHFRNKNYSTILEEDKFDEISGIKNKGSIFSSTVRIAIEDAEWFLLNFRHDFLSLEKIIKKYVDDDKHMSVLCTYNISKFSESSEVTITAIVESHGYIILEDPLVIYKSAKR